jgi:hypothetical protein
MCRENLAWRFFFAKKSRLQEVFRPPASLHDLLPPDFSG